MYFLEISPFSELNLITNSGLRSVKSFKLANWVVSAICYCPLLLPLLNC